MEDSLARRAAQLIESLGLARADEVQAVRPLAGGVASDIAVATLRGRELCVKFALPKLRVAQDWHAPVHRSRAEYAWLEAARAVIPGSVPALHGWSAKDNGFVMEFVADGTAWKALLLRGVVDEAVAVAVGDALGRVHAASAAPGFDRGPFGNRDDFASLRIEPYLLFTAGRHASVAPRLQALASALYEADAALVHGDVSPKNILVRPGRDPVLLDAECATMGDPCFDVAFLLNHLALKSIHLPGSRDRLLAAARAAWAAYRPHVRWEDPAALEERVAALLPALMLARVDGKSPVEYLSEAGRAAVRVRALPLIAAPRPDLAAFLAALAGGAPG